MENPENRFSRWSATAEKPPNTYLVSSNGGVVGHSAFRLAVTPFDAETARCNCIRMSSKPRSLDARRYKVQRKNDLGA